jgi:hypothetical protein
MIGNEKEKIVIENDPKDDTGRKRNKSRNNPVF